MQIRVRTLMAIVALMAIGFALTDPATALLLIFGCPLWFVRFARMHGGRAGGPAGDETPAPTRRPPAP